MSSPFDELTNELRLAFFPLQVLVVDDDAGARRSVERVLEDLGHGVVSAGSAEHALELLQHTHVPIDLLVTDVQMPGMLGDALAERVREAWPDLPVLFVSGEPRFADLPVVPGGRAAFLPKPFSAEELRESIHAVLHPGPIEPDPAP